MKNYFIQGSIKPEFIAASIAKHQSKTDIGAHAIFLGQVRDDEISGNKVKSLFYSAYETMAEKEISRLREEMFTKYTLKCLHIHHSLGEIKTGEISFFVFVSSAHRKASFDALEELVDKIKTEVPIWKKEIFDESA
jgi:molybdopterin synthase catalytic subunit